MHAGVRKFTTVSSGKRYVLKEVALESSGSRGMSSGGKPPCKLLPAAGIRACVREREKEKEKASHL